MIFGFSSRRAVWLGVGLASVLIASLVMWNGSTLGGSAKQHATAAFSVEGAQTPVPTTAPATPAPSAAPGNTSTSRSGGTPAGESTVNPPPAQPAPGQGQGHDPTPTQPTLAVGATKGTQDYTGPCDENTSVTFNGTAYIGTSESITRAAIHWTFAVTAGAARSDSGTYSTIVRTRAEGMVALGLMYETIKLPNTAPGQYSITGRYTVDSADTLAAEPSAASITIHVTCT